MDEQTRRVLAEITARMPSRLKDHLMKTETDDRELELVEHALSSRFISDDKKRYLRALKDKGAFKPIVEQVVDEDIEKEIDAYYTRAINEAKRTGRLKEPDENDPWFRERMNRMGRNTA